MEKVILPRNPINGWIVISVPSPLPIGMYQGWSPCVNWCKLNIKESNWRYIGEGAFEFRRADDHLLFLLRWA